jgi:serine protease Do
MKIILSSLAGALLGCFMMLGLLGLSKSKEGAPASSFIPVTWSAPASTLPTPPLRTSESAAPAVVDLREAAKKSVNAVVHVKTTTRTRMQYNPWMDFWGISPVPQMREASGSGVIIDASGFILTNNHVIHGAERIEVSLNDRRSFLADVVGVDPATDLAVLHIADASGLPHLDFGSSDRLEVGEWVLAVGNPFDLTSTVTAGIVSAKARSLQLLQPDDAMEVFPIESFIQTDAAVNPGNSGGALVNDRGELIGINTAIASKTGSYAGYAFAVPSSIAQKVSQDLIAYGRVQRAFRGIQGTGVTAEIAKDLELEGIRGVYVHACVPSGGAALAGIESGDVILSINGQEVNTIAQLQEQVAQHTPGTQLSIRIAGQDTPISVTLRDSQGGTGIKDRLHWSEERS